MRGLKNVGKVLNVKFNPEIGSKLGNATFFKTWK